MDDQERKSLNELVNEVRLSHIQLEILNKILEEKLNKFLESMERIAFAMENK